VNIGKIIVSQVDPKTGKKVVPPVEIPIKITAEGGTPEGTPDGENPTPDVKSVLESLGIGGGGSTLHTMMLLII